MLGQLYSDFVKKATASLALGLCFLLPAFANAKAPNDPQYNAQATFWAEVGAPAAWDATIGSRDVVVAVIDTGVMAEHPDLNANIWTNPDEIPGNNIDDDNNGYVDDIHGWNFVENNPDVSPNSKSDAEPDPDALRHGTISAGIIGAVGDNNLYGTGLNWHVRIMPLRAIKSSGAGYTGTVINAINYAVANGVDVISLSFVGAERVEPFFQALKNAYEHGVVVVAAAGNHNPNESGDLDAKPLYPVCYNREANNPIVIGVAAVNLQGTLSRFSDTGRCVDIAAPGEQIFSTQWYDQANPRTDAFGGPAAGTSYATPFVAGAAALLKSVRPDWGPDEIIANLKATATSIPGQPFGLLAVDRAVTLAMQTKLVGTPRSAVYYGSGQTLWAYDLTERTAHLVGRFQGGTILDVAQKPTALARDQELAVLLKRGNYFFIMRLKPDGTAAEEFAMPTTLPAASSLKWQKVPGTSDRIVIAGYDTKRKQTVFTSFLPNGERQSQLRINGAITTWQPSSQSTDVYIATLDSKKKIVTLVQRSWDGVTNKMQKLANIDFLDSMAVGQFFAAGSEQVALIARSGANVRQIVADVNSQSFRQDLLAKDTARKIIPYTLLGSSIAGEAIEGLLRYKLSGGEAQLSSLKTGIITTWNLPDFAKLR